ncbi:MAG TPA: GvpL/GvpF family gas vesicle protein [Pyrinomonadaceae bacterium]|nr:GvpL/GvpF family gas vesicle protein [Pyrinomonadaceae bacterium]
MKLYLYCLIDDDVTVENVIYSGENEGISGTAVTLFRPGDFALLVSDFDGASVPVTRDNILKHAAVVNSVLQFTTPLPFRFGTLASEPELESYLTARSKALQTKLAAVRDCVEMNVKIIWDRQWTEDQSEVEMTPGTAFLREKRRQIFGSEARTAEAKRIAGWLEERLGDSIRETRINTNTTDKLLVTAALLVERGSIDKYRNRLKNARLERPELHFLASGPWPPYSFANIDLEFKTQFGVS